AYLGQGFVIRYIKVVKKEKELRCCRDKSAFKRCERTNNDY
ncbi:MAG: hypothetical protein ACJAZM_001978, partial [Cyclobacteriaceae bacterium]